MLHGEWRVRPGHSYPLGATLLEDGVNFGVYSRAAERVEVCLFDDGGERELARLPLPGRTGYVWHGFVPGIGEGQLYGLRVHGPFEPEAGLRFNPAKLLIDPYARALAGDFVWGAGNRALIDGQSANPADSAACMPKCVVLGDAFDWQGVVAPRRPWRDTVIYETHVKGFSVQHPEVPPEVRGTFLGLASEAAIRHFLQVGVTALELLPVTARSGSERLHRLGLSDYWGYGPIALFAPDARFSASGDRGGQVAEFKQMVRELHRHGIEVILDVVYNHTSESAERGPTLSFRGIDNATYYRLDPMNPARYVNFTGTGNTLNLHERPVLRLVMDSLRYWVQEMHVDGFRFDLASTLARGAFDVDARASFLDAVYQDPVLSTVKLIAEPWDLGPNGYQAGRFPAPWSEWNDRYRDDMRRYWRGDEIHASTVARRLLASADVYGGGERGPETSINYVASHDGFTLQDLVSYREKHNLANGEDNRDGSPANYSENFGVEGPARDAGIQAAREQQKRNLLATLLFSQGVPMLLGGDEIGRTQRGNNNPYNQDNATSWYDWQLDSRARELRDFVARLTTIRRRHPNLRRGELLDGGERAKAPRPTIAWLREDGHSMTAREWDAPWYRCFALLIEGDGGDQDADGQPVQDDPLLLILNASTHAIAFVLPAGVWDLVVDTARPEVEEGHESFDGGRSYSISPRSLALLRRRAT